MCAECLARKTTHKTICETVGAGFKAVGNKLQTVAPVLPVGSVSKPSGPLRNHPARFKTI